MSAVGGHLHIFRVVRTTHRNVKRVNRILLQVTERIEPLSCDEMQLQLGCDFGESQYEPVLLARAVRVAVLRANGCSAGIGVGHSRVVARLATRRAKPSGDGVHFTPLERVLEALRLSTVQLQNTFGTTLGAQIAAMVRSHSRYRLK